MNSIANVKVHLRTNRGNENICIKPNSVQQCTTKRVPNRISKLKIYYRVFKIKNKVLTIVRILHLSKRTCIKNCNRMLLSSSQNGEQKIPVSMLVLIKIVRKMYTGKMPPIILSPSKCMALS